MNTAELLNPHPTDTEQRLAFFRKLQALTTKIHATAGIEEIMLDLGIDFCDLLQCDRAMLYAMDVEKDYIVSSVKAGLTASREVKVAVNAHSVPGFVALTHKTVNIADVYDEHELRRLSPELRFQHGVDQRTGYRTREMLVAPLLAPHSDELLGVVQFINNRAAHGQFKGVVLDGVRELCETLAVALSQRARPQHALRGKYDGLVADAVLSAAELDQAIRAARRQGVDAEDVLVSQFHVAPAAIGAALAAFHGVPYAPFERTRAKPAALLKNLTRQYAEESGWLPLDVARDGMTVLATDPERLIHTRIVNQFFPRERISYRVTGKHEFRQTVASFFGPTVDAASAVPAAASAELARLVQKIILDACQQGASAIHIGSVAARDDDDERDGKIDKLEHSKTSVRFCRDGVLAPHTEIPAAYRAALTAHVRQLAGLADDERHLPQHGTIAFGGDGVPGIALGVATTPSADGLDDIVLRMLAPAAPLTLAQLDMLPRLLERVRAASAGPHGLLLVAAPPASGTTSALAALARHAADSDPAGPAHDENDEYVLGDGPSAEYAVAVALTGQRMFAALPAPGAAAAVARLLELGAPRAQCADALRGVLALRLAHRLCRRCRQAYHPGETELALLLTEYCAELAHTAAFIVDPKAARAAILAGWRARHADLDGRYTLYRAVGCDDCSNGYRGKLGLHEWLEAGASVQRWLREPGNSEQLLVAAMQDGMATLKMDGIEKVLAGATDIKTVRAVCSN